MLDSVCVDEGFGAFLGEYSVERFTGGRRGRFFEIERHVERGHEVAGCTVLIGRWEYVLAAPTRLETAGKRRAWFCLAVPLMVARSYVQGTVGTPGYWLRRGFRAAFSALLWEPKSRAW